MAKATNPLFSGDARGKFSKLAIYKKGGIVTRIFSPRNPQTEAQEAHREAFRRYWMAALTQAEADLLYALIMHPHVHDDLGGLDADDHPQYLTEGRADARYQQIGEVVAFPVGSIFITAVNTNPAALLGYGEWSAIGAGRVLAGYDAGQVEFNATKKTGGAKTHVLAVTEMPSHTHTQNAHLHTQVAHTHSVAAKNSVTGFGTGQIARGNTSGTSNPAETGSDQPTINSATATNQNTGGGGAHNNLQPYLVVHFWERVA